MGTYTEVDYADLTLRDNVSVEEGRLVLESIEDEYKLDRGDLFTVDYITEDRNGVKITTVSFNLPDGGWKIISYWYRETLEMLEKMATVLDGDIYLRYETNEEGGIIHFKGGEVAIEIGTMTWESYTTSDFCDLIEMTKIKK